MLALALFGAVAATPSGALRPDSAWAHSELTAAAAQPAAGGGGYVLKLTFSEDLDPGFTQIRVFDAQGVELAHDTARVAPDARHVELTVQSAVAGTYTIAWFIRAQDGDTSNGTSPLTIGDAHDPVAMLPPLNARDPAWQPPMTWQMSALSSFLRWLNYLGAALSAGAVFFGLLVWPAARPAGLPGAVDRQVSSVLRSVFLAGLGTLFLSNILLILLQVGYLQTALLQPVDSASPIPLPPSTYSHSTAGAVLGQVLTTYSGIVWMVRMALVVGLAVAAWRMGPLRTRRPRVWAVAGVGAAAILLTISLAGHAAVIPEASWAVPLDWSHLLAMGAWLGGLLPLLLVLVTLRGVSHAAEGSRLVVARFSRVALTAVAYLALTGVGAALLHVGRPALLGETLYGVVLDVKLLLVAALVGMGALNRYVLIPRLRATDAPAGRLGLGRTLPVEIGLGSMLLLAVAVMASIGTSVTSWEGHRALGVTQTSSAEGVHLTLRIAPGAPGQNAVAVDVDDPRADGAPAPGLSLLTIDGATPQSSRLITAQNSRTERYVYPAVLGLSGEVHVRFHLERTGLPAVDHTFLATLR